MEQVWIVSWCEYGEAPVVTPFNNKEAAEAYYNYELTRNHEKTDIDLCDAYTTFTITDN